MATTETTAITISDYMRKPEIMERFTALLGKDAEPFVQSVLIVVGSDDKLRECTPQSVYKSALRAATLRLSCDPALKQGWIVPYNKNIAKKGEQPKWIKEANFQTHYLGDRTLAMRTGKYWTINVSEVCEGQRVLYNPLTGLHAVMEDNGIIGQPKAANPAYVDVTHRRRKDMKIIGWLAYYKAKNGEEKSVYMSVEDIDDWARMYVKDYLDEKGEIKNPNWKDPKKRPTMEMKTVLRRLLDWTDKSDPIWQKLAEVLKDDSDVDVIDASAEDMSGEVKSLNIHSMTYEQASQTIVKMNGGGERFMSELNAEQLNAVIEKSILPDVVEAAKIVLKQDFSMDPPEAEKKSKEQLQAELGFS